MNKIGGWIGKYFSKRQKKDLYYYRITLGKDISGKRLQSMKRGFSTEREAKKALRTAQTLADKGGFILPSNATYKEYLTEWFEMRKSNLGKQTIVNQEINIRVHIIPLLGHIQLTELNVQDIEKFLTKLRKKGLAEATIKKIHTQVSSSLISAVKKDMIQKNVAAFVENKPKIKRTLVEVWDELEVKHFLDYVSKANTRYYMVFHIAIATGMRQGEILGLRWCDVDFDRRLISVKQTLSHNGSEFGLTKTSSSNRTISLDEKTMKLLMQHRAAEIKEREENNLDTFNEFGPVIQTALGTPLKPRSLDKIWNKLRNKAGMRRITFHGLRHTHASLLLKNNIHPKIVSERLGHSSIQITLDRYSHLFSNMQENAAIGLGKMLFDSEPEDETETT